MRTIITLTASMIALLAGVALAQAQPARDQDARHPDTPAQGATPGRPITPADARQAGPGVDQGQMTPMMRRRCGRCE